MATHSSVLAWRIPGTTDPGGLPSMGSHRVGHNWNDLAAAVAVAIKLSAKDQQGGTLSAPFWCLCQKLYFFYTLINFYHTKALSNQALSLAWDGIPLLHRTRIPASFMVQQQPFSIVLQAGGLLPGPETGLLSNIRKRIVRGDTCWQSKRFYWEGHPGGEQ